MNQLRSIRRTASVAFALCSSLLGFALFAPSAFAVTMPPPGGALPQSQPAVVHSALSTGMAGWQITLIAIGAALLAATLAVLMERARAARRTLRAAA